jgi:hypothetical protein
VIVVNVITSNVEAPEVVLVVLEDELGVEEVEEDEIEAVDVAEVEFAPNPLEVCALPPLTSKKCEYVKSFNEGLPILIKYLSPSSTLGTSNVASNAVGATVARVATSFVLGFTPTIRTTSTVSGLGPSFAGASHFTVPFEPNCHDVPLTGLVI